MTSQKNQKSKYKLVANPQDNGHWYIELTGGPYDGLIYKYGKISFKGEPNKDGTLNCKYELDILTVPEHLKNNPMNEEEEFKFYQYVGKILEDIIMDDLKDIDGNNGAACLKE